MSLAQYREVWLLDFEFHAPVGERPAPICMVAKEWHSGRTLRLWGEGLASSPFVVSDGVLFAAYYSSAEWGCFLALDWQLPTRVLDLFVEFRCLTNGLPVPCGNGLLGAMAFYGLDAVGAVEKTEMRDLAIRGEPFTDTERSALLNYCESDVEALAKLLPRMLPSIDLPRAIFRGRYTVAAACMEWNGVPIDVETLDDLRQNWEPIKARLIQAVDADFSVYVPTGRRTIDPATPSGAAIMEVAADWEIDPYALRDAVEHLWRAERESGADHDAALAEARRRTGLTPNRINRLEDRGKDHSTIPRFDETARELAGELPQLGIGGAFDGDADRDAPAELFALLREPKRVAPRRHDPDLLARAAEMVAAAPAPEYAGPLTFSSARFASWLIQTGIPWPHLATGELDLSDEAFRQAARSYPAVAPLRELRYSLSQLRLNELAVGSDDRNRCLLSMFRARTGRNQPSNSKFIFGPSTWLRSLIAPPEGAALCYCDWSAQEIAIAAALSGDKAMQDAYRSGDPYLWLGKVGGVIPADATKRSHPELRDVFKIVYLAANYGMRERSLSQLIGRTEAEARELLRLHRERFRTFWRWSDSAVDHAMLRGWIQTVFGWRIQVGPDCKPTSLRNFPVQANGADMMRLAACLATERGIEVCCPVHDAFLIEAPENEIEGAVKAMQAAMAEASREVLSGFELRTDAKIVRSGEQYSDPRGEKMWQTVQSILAEIGEAELAEVPF